MLTIPPLITETERGLLQNLIAKAKRILICGHRGPDGDAVGSALGWADYLKRLGKETVIMMPNPFPDFLRWLPGIQDISFYMRHEAEAEQTIKSCDLVFCLDFNALHRLMEMGDVIAAHAVDKTRRLRELLDRRGSKALIEIDGGVNRETGKLLVDAGADVLVAGSAIFKAPDPEAEVLALKALTR